MNKLYIVYEDYMGRKDIIGIFKEIENARYYQENYSSFCHVKPIITDFEVEKEALDDAKKAGKISGYTRDSIRCFMQKIDRLNDVLNLSTNETFGYKVQFKESEA